MVYCASPCLLMKAYACEWSCFCHSALKSASAYHLAAQDYPCVLVAESGVMESLRPKSVLKAMQDSL